MAIKKKPVKKVPLTPEELKAKANKKALEGLYGAEGVAAGNALNNKFLQPGALGRVDTNLAGASEQLERLRGLHDSTARDPMQSDVLNRMKGGLEGYTSEENQAQREQMERGLNSGYATSAGQLAKAQARGKVYGAAGAAQQQNLIRSTQDSRDTLQQDLMVKNIDEKNRRLTEYGNYGRGLNDEEFNRRAGATKLYGETESGLRDEELGRQKLNLGQANAETAAQIGAFTGAGATAIAKKNQKRQNQIQKAALRSQGLLNSHVKGLQE